MTKFNRSWPMRRDANPHVPAPAPTAPPAPAQPPANIPPAPAPPAPAAAAPPAVPPVIVVDPLEHEKLKNQNLELARDNAAYRKKVKEEEDARKAAEEKLATAKKVFFPENPEVDPKVALQEKEAKERQAVEEGRQARENQLVFEADFAKSMVSGRLVPAANLDHDMLLFKIGRDPELSALRSDIPALLGKMKEKGHLTGLEPNPVAPPPAPPAPAAPPKPGTMPAPAVPVVGGPAADPRFQNVKTLKELWALGASTANEYAKKFPDDYARLTGANNQPVPTRPIRAVP